MDPASEFEDETDHIRTMRFFLTGASGFVGSHLLTRLLDEGHAVAVLVRPESDPWRIEDQLAHATRIEGTLDDPDSIAARLRSFAPETVIHLGWSGVGSRFHDDTAQEKNLDQLSRLLELSARLGVKNWIGLGSQAEYGPSEDSIAEDQSTDPVTAYGRVKLATCQMAEDHCNGAGMRFAWMRLFSAYGPKDNAGWFLPALILTLLRGEEPAMTAGKQLCDYLYVEDAAEALLRVVENPAAGGIFNLGSGSATTIRDVAERTRDLIDPSLSLGLGKVPYAPGQRMRLEADVTRLCHATGWKPTTSLNDGLAETVTWFRNNRSRYEG